MSADSVSDSHRPSDQSVLINTTTRCGNWPHTTVRQLTTNKTLRCRDVFGGLL